MYKLDLEMAEKSEIKFYDPLDYRKSKKFQKNTYFYFTDYTKAFDCVDHNKLWKILKRNGNTLPASWEAYMQVKKQQLELDME